MCLCQVGQRCRLLDQEGVRGVDQQCPFIADNGTAQVHIPALDIVCDILLIDGSQSCVKTCPFDWIALRCEDLQGGTITDHSLLQILITDSNDPLAVSSTQVNLDRGPDGGIAG